ncbi:YwpF-like family protein [Jeotgalibacillus aurantiacus]|uniref:YwpF-like family protein n=1 Tax=Jeotgalibacillus aurantiacus TaxID=2763266 RepID=UPI001D0A91E4|nr:YwpF-like family protein [Jeotgalibacillus aurantiacus]
MKTFKLKRVQIVENDTIRDFNLIDGLIINKEDDHHTWILEVFLVDRELEYFQRIQQNRENIEVLAVISSEKNDPASLYAHVHAVRPIGEKISVLFIGHMRNQRNEYAEELLASILEKENLSGEELLAQFKKQMKEKPGLVKR